MSSTPLPSCLMFLISERTAECLHFRLIVFLILLSLDLLHLLFFFFLRGKHLLAEGRAHSVALPQTRNACVQNCVAKHLLFLNLTQFFRCFFFFFSFFLFFLFPHCITVNGVTSSTLYLSRASLPWWQSTLLRAP